MFTTTFEMDQSFVLYLRKAREAELNHIVRNSVSHAMDDLLDSVGHALSPAFFRRKVSMPVKA